MRLVQPSPDVEGGTEDWGQKDVVLRSGCYSKIPSPGGPNDKHLPVMVLEAGRRRRRCRLGVGRGPTSWVADGACSVSHVAAVGEGPGSALGSLLPGHEPHSWAPHPQDLITSQWPNLQTPPPLRMRVSTAECGGNANPQSVSDVSKMVRTGVGRRTRRKHFRFFCAGQS